MNIKQILPGLLVTFIGFIPSPGRCQTADFNVIPRPQQIEYTEEEGFQINSGTIIYYSKHDKEMKREATYLSEIILQNTGWKLDISTRKPKTNFIILSTGLNHQNSEAYTLTCNHKGITIQGSSASGVFYGIQTLRKSLPSGTQRIKSIPLPAVHIVDAPRFSYRGTHLDVSRHFIGTDSILRFLDMLALHNINHFHWHLTDDQGWRIEIKKYPKLTEIGSYRPETVIGHNTGTYDGVPHHGFYTQEDLRKIVRYAKERHITIVPEIDMPGHMLAALAAYPELGCTGGPYKIWTKWGVSDDVLCIGNDKTLQFIENVLTEVADIFPSEYIHVGGDECPKTRWKTCPKCQQRIHDHHLEADKKHTAEERLQSYAIHHAERHLNALGRRMIGWDETLEGGLAPNATVMSWRGEGGGIEAAKQHHNVIMTPNTHLYFDYYQTRNTIDEPEAIGGYIPVEMVYNYEPLPSSLSPEDQKHIIGVQANIWTEYMPDLRQVEYMALPRLAALSEVQWTQPCSKNYKDFTLRLPHLIEVYKKEQYNYAKHIFDIKERVTSSQTQKSIRVELSTIDNAPVYYTIDGTTPTPQSIRYQDHVIISESCQFKAAAFRREERSHLFQETFTFNKATAKAIELLQPSSPMYSYGGKNILTDGLQGQDTNFKSGRWIGFYGNDLEAVIDLSQPTEISYVAFNTCVEKGYWIFDTRGVEISLSDDGEHFTSVIRADYPPMKPTDPNQISRHDYSFVPTTTRFVKIKVLSERQIPAWHPGREHTGFLFVDELIIK